MSGKKPDLLLYWANTVLGYRNYPHSQQTQKGMCDQFNQARSRTSGEMAGGTFQRQEHWGGGVKDPNVPAVFQD